MLVMPCSQDQPDNAARAECLSVVRTINRTYYTYKRVVGELNQLLSKAKEILGRALWKGAEAKRWQRVPKRKGAYTLDLRLLESE